MYIEYIFFFVLIDGEFKFWFWEDGVDMVGEDVEIKSVVCVV